MRRRIVFDIEAEGTENIIDSITKIMMDKVDLNCEFSISQEIVPERISEKKEIQIPAFLQNRCMNQQEKGMREAIHKEQRGVSVHG